MPSNSSNRRRLAYRFQRGIAVAALLLGAITPDTLAQTRASAPPGRKVPEGLNYANGLFREPIRDGGQGIRALSQRNPDRFRRRRSPLRPGECPTLPGRIR